MRASLNADKSDAEANEFLNTVLKDYGPKWSTLGPQLPEKASSLKTELSLTNFGMKKDSFHVSLERSTLWTARLTTAGRRTVAVVNMADVKQHLKNEGCVGKDPKLWLKEAGPT